MERLIWLTDVDRAEEPLQVSIEARSETTLRVLVPNTVVHFELRRSGDGRPFEGALGGRYFLFEPEPASAATAKVGTRRK
ncbi:hypothetical protein [Methylosinus sp. LW4]|uniref:hypothetical protein n=1 Tax=Methylosinus sp. LW4 TaxID=136993 RepID=UPI000360FF6A|nr:hypothetical protein [Methylosinus sp. LW4]